MSRVLSIDIMRGFALMCMVLIHFMIYFGDSTAVSTWPHFILDHVLGDWGAACFLMMMSMSQVLSADKRTDDPLPLFKRALIRGGYIFMIGILMLALTWGPSEIWQWDILTLMGTMTVILFFCRFLPSWLILVVSLFIAVATLWLRAGIDFASIWGGPFVQVPIISQYFPGILVDPVSGFTRIWKLQDVLLGFLFTGEFPLLPWSLFPLVGFVIAAMTPAFVARQTGVEVHGLTLAGAPRDRVSEIEPQIDLREGDLADAAWVRETVGSIVPDAAIQLLSRFVHHDLFPAGHGPDRVQRFVFLL